MVLILRSTYTAPLNNREAPHSALNIQSSVEFYAGWLVKNKARPVHN